LKPARLRALSIAGALLRKPCRSHATVGRANDTRAVPRPHWARSLRQYARPSGVLDRCRTVSPPMGSCESRVTDTDPQDQREISCVLPESQ
jgi:hypothetical protein